MGAIAGDIIGSVFEHYPIKSTQFELFSWHLRFTDDTVLTKEIILKIPFAKGYLLAVTAIPSHVLQGGLLRRFIRIFRKTSYQTSENDCPSRFWISSMNFVKDMDVDDHFFYNAEKSENLSLTRSSTICSAERVFAFMIPPFPPLVYYNNSTT